MLRAVDRFTHPGTAPGAARPSHLHMAPAAAVARMGSPDSSRRRQELEEMVARIATRFPKVPSMTARELHERLQGPEAGSVVVVDVRTPEEWGVSMLPGNTLTADAFERRRAELGERGADVVVVPYCTVGYRSARFCEQLQAEGFRGVYNLEGSIVAWTQEGFPLVEGAAQEPTKRVHVFGKQWALQGEGYEAVTFRQPFLSLALSSARAALPPWLGGKRGPS